VRRTPLEHRRALIARSRGWAPARELGYNRMMSPAALSGLAASAAEERAFRALERALFRRRLRELDPRLALEVVALALLLAAVLFWQVRVPLDGWAHHHGPLAALGWAAALFAAVAAAGGAIAAVGVRHALASPAHAPEWMALPCGAPRLGRHLEWRARAALPFVLLAQLAIWAAVFGLLNPWALIALGAGAYLVTTFATRAGASLAVRSALGSAADDPVTMAVALAPSRRRERVSRHRAPRAFRGALPFAILAHDLTLTARATAPRSRALLAVALAAAAGLTWLAPWPPALIRAVAFGLALLAAAAAAEWLIDTTALHPCAALRVLPVGVGGFWGARAVGALAAAALITASQLPAARLMDPLALRVHLVWTGAAALAILVFGANLAVTLYPRADHARRVLTLSLALAATASFILPLAGWVLLLTALLHSARRLADWTRGESLSCS
jgi:hypothetical protein